MQGTRSGGVEPRCRNPLWHKHLSACACLGVTILLVATTPPCRAAHAEDRWIILDTGGTGGGFGRGDPGKNLWDVCFWDDRVGMAAGDRGVYRTEDGGLTWRKLAPPTKQRVGWQAIRMAGTRDVWLAGLVHPGGPGKGYLMHSTDAGRTWQRHLADACHGASRLCLTPMGDVWLMTRQAWSFHSPDRGRTWRRVKFGVPLWAADICFPGDVPYATDYVGYAVGHRHGQPVLVKTVDSGKTWKRLALPPHATSPRRVFFTTSREGWICGSNGQVFYTHDGARQWQARHLSAPGQHVFGLWFHRTGYGWAAALQPFDGIGKLLFEHTLFVTPDRGITWTPVMSGWKSAHALWSNGPGTCWTVGNAPGFVANDLVGILDHHVLPTR